MRWQFVPGIREQTTNLLWLRCAIYFIGRNVRLMRVTVLTIRKHNRTTKTVANNSCVWLFDQRMRSSDKMMEKMLTRCICSNSLSVCRPLINAPKPIQFRNLKYHKFAKAKSDFGRGRGWTLRVRIRRSNNISNSTIGASNNNKWIKHSFATGFVWLYGRKLLYPISFGYYFGIPCTMHPLQPNFYSEFRMTLYSSESIKHRFTVNHICSSAIPMLVTFDWRQTRLCKIVEQWALDAGNLAYFFRD